MYKANSPARYSRRSGYGTGTDCGAGSFLLTLMVIAALAVVAIVVITFLQSVRNELEPLLNMSQPVTSVVQSWLA
jgi:hypothetical protein